MIIRFYADCKLGEICVAFCDIVVEGSRNVVICNFHHFILFTPFTDFINVKLLAIFVIIKVLVDMSTHLFLGLICVVCF